MTTGIVPITLYISMDEYAAELYEIVKASPDGQGRHLYRYITVIRGDAPAQHVTDLGLCTDPNAGVAIPSMYEHTVGELMDIAEKLRATAPAPERPDPKDDLIGGYFDIMEQQNRARHNVKPRIYI